MDTLCPRNLVTTDENWLLNLIAKATGYSSATFTGAFAAEFEHLAVKRLKLIDFEAHSRAVKKTNIRAISRTRYGYDSDDDDDDVGFNLGDVGDLDDYF